MKVFRDVQVHGDAAALGEARRRLAAFAATATWERDDQIARTVPTIDATVFKYRGGHAPEALVWLTWEQEAAEVSNIVPCEAGSLTYDEYNGIAERFAKEVLRTTLDGAQLQVEIGNTDENIDDLLSPGTAASLRDFSRSANKATGAAHPMDAERWRRFVIRAHLDDAGFGADALQRWLNEDEGWDDDQAIRLAIQYEQARDLLRQYDEERGDD